MSHKVKRLLANGWRKKPNALFFLKQVLIMSAHVGSRLIFFLSVVGNFLLVLSVVSNIFNPIHTLFLVFSASVVNIRNSLI